MSSKLEKLEPVVDKPPFVIAESVDPTSVLPADVDGDRNVLALVAETLEGHVWLPNYIKAIVKNGWVTLTGLVTWDFERMSAVHNIKKIEGVRGVQNKIELNQPWLNAELKRSIATAPKQQARLELMVTYKITPYGNFTLRKQSFMA